MLNICVRCGKEFDTNISLDKHARRCKATTNTTCQRKRARLDEDDHILADVGDYDVLGSGSNVCTRLSVP
jgi:hypothetical protein